METQWSETHSMQNPMADVRGGYAVVANRDGTTMEIYDSNGLTGTVSTSYSIIKVRISQNGLVAAILANGEDTWINFTVTTEVLLRKTRRRWMIRDTRLMWRFPMMGWL